MDINECEVDNVFDAIKQHFDFKSKLEDTYRDTIAAKNKPILQEYIDEISAPFKVKISKTIQKDAILDTYNMSSKTRGILFLINIYTFLSKGPRLGSKEDAVSMIHLFRKMGYKVFFYQDICKHEFYELLDILLQSDYCAEADSFVLCIMSHGNMSNNVDHVYFYGEQIESVKEILKRFKNDNASRLFEKPKIFIFPFCRGENSDPGVKIIQKDDSIKGDNEEHVTYSTYSDIMICYGTIPDYATHRAPKEGSWYIQTFCKIFAEYAHNTEFEKLLKLVGNHTLSFRTKANQLQTPSAENHGFFKHLYFNPGCWMEGETFCYRKDDESTDDSDIESENSPSNSLNTSRSNSRNNSRNSSRNNSRSNSRSNSPSEYATSDDDGRSVEKDNDSDNSDDETFKDKLKRTLENSAEVIENNVEKVCAAVNTHGRVVLNVLENKFEEWGWLR